MTKATIKLRKEIRGAFARYYHQALSETRKRGIQAAKARKKLPTRSIWHVKNSKV